MKEAYLEIYLHTDTAKINFSFGLSSVIASVNSLRWYITKLVSITAVLKICLVNMFLIFYSEPATVESKDLTEAWNHCKKWSKSIELFYHNDNDEKVLAKVHFRSYPAVSVHINVMMVLMMTIRMNCQKKSLKR